VESVRQAILDRLATEGASVRLVVCDLSTSPYVDLAGVRMLARLGDELAKRGIALRLTEASGPTRDLLRAEGVDAKLGGIDRFTSVADEVDDFHERRSRAPA
jgi:MFS superfamily sulfate permease-like transporter